MRQMHLTRATTVQLVIFGVVAVSAMSYLGVAYMRLPNLLFGIGHYEVRVELPESGGIYRRGNVTYRGLEVGRIKDVRLTPTGVEAVLSLRSDTAVPSNLEAEVHSQSAVGEQYIELLPRDDISAPLRNGDVISRDRTSVPPDINDLLSATNRSLKAIPKDNLKTVIDESYIAFGGLGPEIARLVNGETAIAAGARQNLSDLTNLVDNSKPLLDTQTSTSDSVRAWSSHLAAIAKQLQEHDADVAGLLRQTPDALQQARELLDGVQPTLPVLMANLASVAPVLVTYRAGIEQLLVLVPLGVEMVQGSLLAGAKTNNPHKGIYLNFSLNLNLPPPCTTGFLPAQQIRVASETDSPQRPMGDLYCRIPQDAPFNVRGARNIPCETRPGKRAPTVKLCESDEQYVPLNDGFNWKGDPNATFSGQDIPQLPPGQGPKQGFAPPPPVAIAEYDPATGNYMGPDGRMYTQADLATTAPKDKTWQSMLTPPPPN